MGLLPPAARLGPLPVTRPEMSYPDRPISVNSGLYSRRDSLLRNGPRGQVARMWTFGQIFCGSAPW